MGDTELLGSNNSKDKSGDNSGFSVKNMIIIGLFSVAIIYIIIVLLKSSFEKPILYSESNLSQYTTSENLVKNDYFYVIDAEIANFLEAVDRELYNELYNIMDSKYKREYSKSFIIDYLKNCKENIFKYDNEGKKKFTEHLINLYRLPSGQYLAQLDFNDEKFYMIISEGKKSYNFTIVE